MKFLDKNKLDCNIKSIAQYDLDNNNVFGSSYYVFQKGNLEYKKHFGNIGMGDCPKVNDNTIYRLASMTKPVTAVAMLILADRGVISLSDPISKYLPEFENIRIVSLNGDELGRSKTDVTIMHCLTHTSGFGSERSVEMSDSERNSISDTIKFFVNAGLEFEPFTKQFYSAFAAFDVLAAVAEKVTDTDYEEFLQKEIFLPCGMTNTTFMPATKQWQNIITMHNKADGKNAIGTTTDGCIFEKFPCTHKLAGAGLVSTIVDYSNFARMLLGQGEINGNRILSEKMVAELARAHVPEDIMPGSERWGLAVRVITDEAYGALPVGSYGWSGAYGSHFWVDPANDICAVFMKNSRFDGGAGNMSAQRFEKAVFDALK